MPTTTPDIKVKAVRRLGGTVELVGDSYTETQTHAQACGSDPPLLSGIAEAPAPCRTLAKAHPVPAGPPCSG